MDTNVNQGGWQDNDPAFASQLLLAAMVSAIKLREVELESMDITDDGGYESQIAEARNETLCRIDAAISAITGRPAVAAERPPAVPAVAAAPAQISAVVASAAAEVPVVVTPVAPAAAIPPAVAPAAPPAAGLDVKSAQGQNRTTKTKWADVLPYIRFRYERAREMLPASGTVYEMGCGIGVGLNYLATSRTDLTFVGLDNSQEALTFGRHHFGGTANLTLQYTPDFASVATTIAPHSFLVALEVIEHLNDEQLDFFKRTIMQNVDEAVFSFPYNEQNIEGTNHLQSIDIYTIFEIFPGFRTLFMRRNSIKFIGHWKRSPLPHAVEPIHVRGEGEAIPRICNWDFVPNPTGKTAADAATKGLSPTDQDKVGALQ
jgi:hypothetical protein